MKPWIKLDFLERVEKLLHWIDLLNSNVLFIRWKIKIILTKEKVILTYRVWDTEIITERSCDELKLSDLEKYIKWLVIDIYYEYERDGKPVDKNILCCIMNKPNANLIHYVDGILKKIKVIYSSTYLEDSF